MTPARYKSSQLLKYGGKAIHTKVMSPKMAPCLRITSCSSFAILPPLVKTSLLVSPGVPCRIHST